jgi:uncharacterized protein (TIGR02268 family)
MLVRKSSSPPTQLGAVAVLKPALALLLLMALPGRADSVLPVAPGGCGPELRNVELEVGTPPMWICIAPEVATYLRFDTPILVDRMMLEGDAISILPTSTGIMLVGTRELGVGERRRLTVFFADEHEPSSATFLLIGQGAGKLRQVNIFRRARTAASLRQEAEEQRQRAESCEQQLALNAGMVASSGLLERLMRLGRPDGITLQWHTVAHFTSDKGNASVRHSETARTEVEGGQFEAAVRFRLRNDGTEAWTLEGASLTSVEGVSLANVRVFAGGPIPAGDFRRIYVAVGPTDRDLTGTHTLRLWGGGREVLVEGVRFP